MALDQQDIDRLKEIFVTRRECDERNEEHNKLTSRIDVRLSVIEENQKQQKWLTKTILGAVLTLVVTALWALITGGA